MSIWQCIEVVLLGLLSIAHVSLSEYRHLMKTFSGSVGAGNYSYYKLTQEGSIQIELVSRKGDADIYVSDLVLSPTYENYELQSCTCGKDEVSIELGMKRPIGIGIYGHPFYEESHYSLSVYILQNQYDPFNSFTINNKQERS